MATDAPTPLATAADFISSPFGDLAANLQQGELDRKMLRATRACESVTGRRLAPFTGLVENTRADAGDLEDSGALSQPMPMQGQMGMDYSKALNVGDMVRHAWVREYAPLYSDMWSASVTSIQVYWAYQTAPYTLDTTQLQFDADTGHIRFLIGTFIPFGSTLRVTYAGGYGTVPADLNDACLTMAASMIVRDLDPLRVQRSADPATLRGQAVEALGPWVRD